MSNPVSLEEIVTACKPLEIGAHAQFILQEPVDLRQVSWELHQVGAEINNFDHVSKALDVVKVVVAPEPALPTASFDAPEVKESMSID